jgi:hypothetical protein
MKLEALYPLLAKPIDLPDVRAAFNDLGIDVSEAVLDDDDFRTYIERKALGVCLIFSDEAMFLAKGDQAIGTGPLYFSGFFLYSEGKDGYAQFSGPLPYNLKFSDTSTEAKAKLGQPEWNRISSKNFVKAERWDVSIDRQLHLTYNDGGTIELLTYFVPDKKL